MSERRRPGLAAALAAFALAASAAADAMLAETSPAEAELEGLAAAWAPVSDYRTLFVREERIDGRLGRRELIELSFKKPFAVRMRWVGAVHRGRDAIFVAGRNGDRIRAREGGLLGLVRVGLDPKGGTAMRGNRHPITDVGIGRAIEILAGEVRAAAARGTVDVRLCPGEEVAGRPARVVELELGPGAGETVRRILWIDREHGLPLRIEGRDGRGELVERYEYLGLALDVGLDESDFPT